MQTTEEINKESLNTFGDLIIQIADVKNDDYLIFHDITSIEIILQNFVEIGEHINVEFSDLVKPFNSFAGFYRKNNFFYLPKSYEESSPIHQITKFLKFKPEKMLMNISENPEYNHLVIQTSAIPTMHRTSDYVSNSNSGIIEIIDNKGTELRSLKGKEKYCIFMTMYKPNGRVVLYPKGSTLENIDKGHYFRKY